ncbi:MAG TPA: hypothetical protein VF103_05385, partial [Polyangiaceae bacterium]
MLDDAAFRALAQRYARLVEELELDSGEPLLVLPNAEFFPDHFTGDAASVERLVARMQGYAGLEALELRVALVGEPAEASGASCGTGACGAPGCGPATSDGSAGPRIERTTDGYLLRVPAEELRHSIVLTARLATSLGAVALVERHPRGTELAGDPAHAELAATALGFGVLLLEASYLYSKSCGGPNVQRATAIPTEELATLFTLFLAREGHALKNALAELGTTQRAVVKAAWVLLDESPSFVALLKKHPERVARGDFSLRDGRSLFSKLFGRAKRSNGATSAEREAAALSALEHGASVDELEDLLGPTAPAARTPRAKRDGDDELRALIDEALDAPASELESAAPVRERR